MAPGLLSEEVPNGVSGVTKEEVPNGVNGVTKEEVKEETKEETKLTNGVTDGVSVELPTPIASYHCSNCCPNTKDGGAASSDREKRGETKSEDGKSEDEDKKDDKPEDQTMKCEMKHLDRKYDEKSETYFVERKSDLEKPKQKDWWQLFAFCLVRHYDEEDDLDYTRLYVNPQPLRQLLKDVIGNYPSDPIDVDDVQIESPYHSLFHYRTELEAEGFRRFAEDEQSLGQFKLLLGWIKSHFELDIAAYDKCIAGEVKAIAYDRLWTIFPPDKIVHCKILGQDRAFRVYNTCYVEDEEEAFWLTLSYVDFDGKQLGTRRRKLTIDKYTGIQDINELTCRPLDLLEDADDLREELVERGKKFEAYIGQHYLQYSGIAVKYNPNNRCYDRFSVSGRVMVDCKTYHRLDPNDAFFVTEFPDKDKNNKKKNKLGGADDFGKDDYTFEKLSDENLMLANAYVRGYSFSCKRFLELRVDLLQPVAWNAECFDGLVLDPAIKKTVQALVSTHASQKQSDGSSFDDIVKGKGQGLVCVLHGPPGVGKTLTAECVAEYVRRPLYMVSSGDLGTDSQDLDRQLTRIMDMTSTWRAVLLIDEADVFLEQRALHDLHRNAMVSVFLRVLEYYNGILFLTTNRVATFDDAFKSRIHIPIRYTDLSFTSRRQIWKTFCARVPGGVDISEAGYNTLAEHDLNGRQIKNAIKAAESLSSFDGVRLDLDQLLQVTKIQAVFEKDLTSLSGIDYTAPGQSKRDADRRNMFL